MKKVKCRNCYNYCNEWCELTLDDKYPDIERDCQYFREKTNADHIRSMPDEELAEWMAECNAYGEGAIASQWMPWLKQPYKEGQDG